MDLNQPFTVKAVLVGDSAVGKSSLFRRFQGFCFPDTYNPTVGTAWARLEVNVSGTPVTVVLWDTAGQEDYRGIVPMYCRDCNVVLVVYAASDRDSFENVSWWVDFSTEQAPMSAKMIFIENKCDLEEQRKVEKDKGRAYALSVPGSGFFETSALTGYGIQQVLEAMAEVGLKVTQSNPIERTENPIEKGKADCC
jgi:small GTP-binding protein